MLNPNFSKIPLGQKPAEQPKDLNIQCLCCRDSGLIEAFVIRRYLFEDYSNLDAPIRCQRPECEGNTVWVENNGGHQIAVSRVAHSVDDRATPELCQQIHDSELKRLEDLKFEAIQGSTQAKLRSLSFIRSLERGEAS
jgi:hypothetical protein